MMPADMPASTLLRRATTVSSWTLASRLLGLVRDRLWAGAFGGSAALDAFQAAFALPNMLRELFGDGALSAAFIPRYVQMREKDPAAAEAFAGAVLTRLALGLAIASGALLLIAAGVVWWSHGRLLTPGGLKLMMVAALAIPQIPYLVFICVTAIAAGVLNGRRHFWAPAAGPVILNVVMISTVGMSVEDECWYLPYAVLTAGFLQCALMLWMVKRTGPLPPLSMTVSPELVELRRALLPTLFASGVYQINAWIGTMLALLLVPGHGAVQFLYFGNRLLQFPLALIGHGVTTAAYPELALSAGRGWAATGEAVRAAARLQAFWLLPAAAGLLVCAEPLVRTIYQVGAFGPEAIARTVRVAQMLALALIPVSLAKLLVRAFHAHRDQRTPMRVSLGLVGLNLILNLILVRTSLQEAGLALATAISSGAGLVAYVVILSRRGAGMVLDLAALIRPLVASILMAIAVAVLLHAWPQPEGRASAYAALRLAAAVGLGMMVYVAFTGLAWLRRRRSQAVRTPEEI